MKNSCSKQCSFNLSKFLNLYALQETEELEEQVKDITKKQIKFRIWDILTNFSNKCVVKRERRLELVLKSNREEPCDPFLRLIRTNQL